MNKRNSNYEESFNRFIQRALGNETFDCSRVKYDVLHKRIATTKTEHDKFVHSEIRRYDLMDMVMMTLGITKDKEIVCIHAEDSIYFDNNELTKVDIIYNAMQRSFMIRREPENESPYYTKYLAETSVIPDNENTRYPSVTLAPPSSKQDIIRFHTMLAAINLVLSTEDKTSTIARNFRRFEINHIDKDIKNWDYRNLELTLPCLNSLHRRMLESVIRITEDSRNGLSNNKDFERGRRLAPGMIKRVSGAIPGSRLSRHAAIMKGYDFNCSNIIRYAESVLTNMAKYKTANKLGSLKTTATSEFNGFEELCQDIYNLSIGVDIPEDTRRTSLFRVTEDKKDCKESNVKEYIEDAFNDYGDRIKTYSLRNMTVTRRNLIDLFTLGFISWVNDNPGDPDIELYRIFNTEYNDLTNEIK